MRPEDAIPGSFRDPAGRVYFRDGRVFRTVLPAGADDYEFVRSTGLLARLVASGRLIAATEVSPESLGAAAPTARYVLEHPRLPFVSHPYEWPFPLLRSAALLQLDLLIESLDAGVTLSDASAYNTQFLGTSPLFIDTLSFRRYREGSFWLAHRQFCEQFLNPLLLRSVFGLPYHAWYRGASEGLSTVDLERLLPWYRKLSPNLFMHIVLQASLQSRPKARQDALRAVSAQRLSSRAFRHILTGLRRWIAALRPRSQGLTVFADYVANNTYSEADTGYKMSFISEFVAGARPKLLLDLGCNTGLYAQAALEAGAGYVVGIDGDQGALEGACERSLRQGLRFLPLHANLNDPPPDQGWEGRERAGLQRRCEETCEAVLALALVHHMAIGGNIPLPRVVRWLVSLAPRGIIEFIPKEDPMVQRLLSLRDDIFPEYCEAEFVAALQECSTVVRSSAIPGSGRRLFQYERRSTESSR